MERPGLGLHPAQRLAARRAAADADRRGAVPARRPRGLREWRSRCPRPPADLGPRGNDRHHAGRGSTPFASRGLHGHGARPPDDVPQPHAKDHALCRDYCERTDGEETMRTQTWSVRRLHTIDESHIDRLAALLIDCVEGGASVSFMLPLTRDRAVAFWRRV